MKDHIIHLYKTTILSAQDIGRQFNLTGSRICQILRSSLTPEFKAKRDLERKLERSNEYKLDPSWTSLYEDGSLSISKIADKLKVPASHIYRAVEANYDADYRLEHTLKVCDGHNRSGDNHPLFGTSWGVPLEDRGEYEVFFVNRKRVHVHANIFKVALGCSYSKHFAVHHIDSNKSNNLLTNLIMITPSTHLKLHHSGADVHSRLTPDNLLPQTILKECLGIGHLADNIEVYKITDSEHVTLDDIGVIIR